MIRINKKEERKFSMYTFETRVRYSECNAKDQACLSRVLDYLQDACTFQAEDLDIGVEYLEKHHAAWMLNSWQVDIQRYPILGEKIKVMTWPYDYHGFYGLRNFKIEDQSGNMIVRANSVWVFMDMKRGRPVKIMPELQEAYQKETKLDMEYLERKIPDFAITQTESDKSSASAFRVPRYFIDTNNHMNNARYVQLAEEWLPQNFVAARIRAEYRKSAIYGESMYVSVQQQRNGYMVKMTDQDGKTYAIVEFCGR